MSNGEKIGEVTHFFGKISVAVVKLNKGIKLGETVQFVGKNTDFSQEITSMQIEHEAVSEAATGAEVALKVQDRVRSGDAVFRLTDGS